jgi:cytochrome c
MHWHRPKQRSRRGLAAVLFAGAIVMAWTGVLPGQQTPPSAPIGRPATPEEISAWDIDIEPDGTGLPPGEGSVASGRQVYGQKCAWCHGPTGTELPGDTVLVPTIARNWCCATTLYDYIHRTMPFYQPQSLKPDEVYGLVALLLHWNGIVPESFVADRRSVPGVAMPAAKVYGVNPYTSSVTPQQGDPWAVERTGP